MTGGKVAKYLLCFGVPALLLMMPMDWIPIQNVALVDQRLIAIFMLAMLCWLFEPIPVFATSILVIMLELLLVSDQALYWLREGHTEAQLGILIGYRDVLGSFASPVIMLFLGGFFLAMAAKKYQLDQNLARVLLKPFGTKPKFVLLGLIMLTAVFSMFMSNTATAAMMLAILMPVLDSLEENDLGKIAFVLAIPFAANIGGIGTPIGTPPNAIAMKYLTGDMYISFGTWMAFAVPYVIVMLLITWLLLMWFFPTSSSRMVLRIKGRFQTSRPAMIVYVTTAVTILLWLFGDLVKLNSYVVAMIPVTVFCTTGIVSAEDIKRLSWDVLWLVAGGIALGMALEKSGLSQKFVASIPFEQFHPVLIISVAMTVILLMATFMSHTATANLVLPITVALGTNLTTLGPYGGEMMMILAVTFTCSLAMALPISTPPNAMAYATNLFSVRDMFRSGMLVAVIGCLGILVLVACLKLVGFL